VPNDEEEDALDKEFQRIDSEITQESKFVPITDSA
jgi:hypothetical protein